MNKRATISTTDTRARCAHCGDRVPAGLVEGGAGLQFCCNGCRTVHEVIHSCGLERYYAIKREHESQPEPARISHRRFGEFDDPVFHRLYVRDLAGTDGTITSVELFLPAVHCAACVWLVEKLPSIAPGVIEARLDLRRALVRIIWDRRATTLSAIARTLDGLGYAPTPAREAAMREARRLADRQQLVRLGVAGACAGNVMLLALAMYAGAFDAIESSYLQLFRWVSMGISLLSLAWPGSVFFRGAWSALRTRTLHLDLPIAVGLGAGAIWGVTSTIRGAGEIYFDSLSVLVFALLLGRFIQTRQQRWSADAIELLFSIMPTRARVLSDEWADQASEAPIEAVQRGMIVETLPGDSIPVDGVIIRGSSTIDQSLLTGESRPMVVREGMGVAAGAVNLQSTLRIRVQDTGEETRIGRLMRLVQDATQRRAPIVRTADRLAGWFVAAMLLLAALTAGLWLLIEPSHAVDNAAALLIVTCPCALGLATPLAVTVAIGRAARRGMLIKGGDALERLSKPGVIFLDKTGTLTLGRVALVRWLGDERIQALVAAAEAHASHLIARALVRDLGEGPSVDVAGVHHSIGSGVEATCDGRSLVIGSPRFVRERCARFASGMARAECDLVQEGLTPVLVAVDGVIAAAAGLGDPIRDDARDAIAALRSRGWNVRMLSGDHPEVVRSVAAQLGIDAKHARGGATPEVKLDVVRAAAGDGTPVIMVGDGVNDAAALAAATVGIAVHGGAEASLTAADIYLNRPGLTAIVDLLSASRRTMHVIRRNLGVSLLYNALAAALAITGVINPLIAAVLMPLSSLTVVTSSFHSRTFDKERAACR